MHPAIALLSCLGLLAPGSSPGTASPAWTVHTLPGGIHLHVLELPQAPRQTTITFLPLGLIQDDPGLSQAGHVVEHLMLRSTDPIGRGDPGLGVEAQTEARAVRLQTTAVPSRWREAQRRHVQWITTGAFDEGQATLERGRIATEEHRSLGMGATHRWALAAWNQVIRHGRNHAAVHEDAQSVPLELLQAYAKGRVRPGPGLWIAVAGPVAAKDVVAAWREDLATLPWSSEPPATSDGVLPATSSRIREVGDRLATWDLEATHYLEWYRVPGETEEDRIRAQVASEVLSLRLQTDPALASAGVRAHATTELATGEGRWILLSASLRVESALDTVRERFRAALDALAGAAGEPRAEEGGEGDAAGAPEGPLGRGPRNGGFLRPPDPAAPAVTASEGLERMLHELVQIPDFARRRRESGRRLGGDFLEAWAVQEQARLSLFLDIPLERLEAAFREAQEATRDPRLWKPVLEEPFHPSLRSSLLLRAGVAREGEAER